MGTVNFASLNGVVTSNTAPFIGSLSSINDNNLNTSTMFKITYLSQGTLQVTLSLNNIFINTIFIKATAVAVYYYPVMGLPFNTLVVAYYKNSVDGVELSTVLMNYTDYETPLANGVSFDLYKIFTKVTVTFTPTDRQYTRDAGGTIYEIAAYGPDIPPSKTRLRANGTTFTAGLDTDAVSPLYIGGQRIALGSTSHLMATPFRYYDDGSTYAILKAQRT